MLRNIGAVFLVIGSLAFCTFLFQSLPATPTEKPADTLSDDVPAAPPAEVQFDPQEQIHAEQFQQQLGGTQTCLDQAHLLYLRQGIRNRKQLVTLGAQMCGSGLRWFMESQIHRPKKEVEAFLELLSNQELDTVLASSH